MSQHSQQKVDFKEKEAAEAIDWECRPEFIYGGPFVKPVKIEPFLDSATPFNLRLSGTFKKSYAYFSLRDRMPVILTRVIDYIAKDGSKIRSSYSANEADLATYLHLVTKLKNDVVTNKNYDLLTEETEDAKKWNRWIEAQEQTRYYQNTWLFTECYIYRRLKEAGELTKSLKTFDPFIVQKEQSFTDHIEPMCIVAEKFLTMLPKSDNDKMKADFITLLKLCLWSNKCDLSLSAGESVRLGQDPGSPSVTLIDPFQLIVDWASKLLVDDSAKIVDTVVGRADAIRKAIEANTSLNKCSCHRLAALAKVPICKEPPVVSAKGSPTSPPANAAEGDEAPKTPCPALMVVPQAVMFDIICDNAGFELFTDLCIGHFLVSQNIVQKVRFHVKAMPWFVSDVTQRDFKHFLDACHKANFFKLIPAEVKEAVEGEPPPEPEQPRTIRAEELNSLGEQWKRLVEEGTFVILAEDYWTWPHTYKDMKQIDYHLYRKLQFACGLLFKGDLNYRKLLGEKKWNPNTGFEASLEGFIPAPVIAVRTVKSEVISGLPKGKYQQLTAIDEKWMEKGDYGLIQVCAKAEPLKPTAAPCADYGRACFGAGCPATNDV